MKKRLMLFAAGVLLSAGIASAQTSTDSSSTQPSTKQFGTSPTHIGNYQNYPTKDMKKITSSQIPNSLRTTLGQPEYSGWENSTFYYNEKAGEYYYQPLPTVTPSSGTPSKNTTWYRFDSNGARVQEKPKQ